LNLQDNFGILLEIMLSGVAEPFHNFDEAQNSRRYAFFYGNPTMNKKRIIQSPALTVLFSVAISILFVSSALAKSQNAADLYYKAFEELESPDKQILTSLRETIKEDKPLTPAARQYIRQQKKDAEILLKASQIRDCDWKLDYTKGAGLKLTGLSESRNLSMLLNVMALEQVEKGDPHKALEYNKAAYSMAGHVANMKCMIAFLVAKAIEGDSNKSLHKIAVAIASDPGASGLISQLPKKTVPLEALDLGMTIVQSTPDEVSLHQFESSGLLSKNDFISEQLPAIVSEYKKQYALHVSRYRQAASLPYVQCIDRFSQLEKKFKSRDTDISERTEYSSLVDSLLRSTVPAPSGIIGIYYRTQAEFNAINAAVQIYKVKAEQGALPDSLPSGLPTDPFSDKAFEYELFADGFVLRCRQKDLHKKQLYEYSFPSINTNIKDDKPEPAPPAGPVGEELARSGVPYHTTPLMNQLQAAYKKQKEGDFDTAVKNYLAILANTKAEPVYIARAYYRLGQCYRQTGDANYAAQLFEYLIKNFPKERSSVAKAKKELKEIQRK